MLTPELLNTKRKLISPIKDFIINKAQIDTKYSSSSKKTSKSFLFFLKFL